MKEFNRGLKTYYIVLSAREDGVFDSVPSAEDIYSALSWSDEIQSQKIWLSDAFAAGFVYKPIDFDIMNIETQEDYKLFKKIKAAKYIEIEVLKLYSTAENLLKALSQKIVKIKGEYIYSPASDIENPFSKYIEPSDVNPLKIKLEKGERIGFYLAADIEENYFEGKKINICGEDFDVVSVKHEPEFSRVRTVLTTRVETTAYLKNGENEGDIFRLLYDNSLKKQFFAAGSIISKESFNFEKLTYPFLPFMLNY